MNEAWTRYAMGEFEASNCLHYNDYGAELSFRWKLNAMRGSVKFEPLGTCCTQRIRVHENHLKRALPLDGMGSEYEPHLWEIETTDSQAAESSTTETERASYPETESFGRE